jgi:hypothetical protein
MSSAQLGEALLNIAEDPGLTEAFTAADGLDAKICLLREQGYTVDSSDFKELAQAVAEAKTNGHLSALSDEDLAAAQGGFFADIAGASIGLGLGAFFGGLAGAGLGIQVGKTLGNVIDEAIGSVIKDKTYDKLNKIFTAW